MPKSARRSQKHRRHNHDSHRAQVDADRLRLLQFVVGVMYNIAWLVVISFIIVVTYTSIADRTLKDLQIDDKWFIVSSFVLLIPLHYLEKYLAGRTHRTTSRNGNSGTANQSGITTLISKLVAWLSLPNRRA